MKNDFSTYRSSYEGALRIRSKKVAAEYFRALVDHCMKLNPRKSRAQHKKIQRENIVFYAGFYGWKYVERMERLFGGKHPLRERLK